MFNGRNDCGGDNSGWIWGFVIFFLILFWAFAGKGFGQNGESGCSNYTTDRDVLKLETAMTSQSNIMDSKLETAFRSLLNSQEKGIAQVIDGQKDMYIKQLEQKATEMFITGQNEQTRNLIDRRAMETEAKGATAACILNHRLDRIEAEMLKRPPFEPFGGLPLVGCNNLPRQDCCNPCNNYQG